MWIGQLVSTSGTSISALAGSVLVFHVTHSALSVGLLLMATAAPSMLIGLIAGVFVDRYDRKRIMIVADLIRAVLAMLIPLLVRWNIGWLYLLVMLQSAVAQFFDPAHASLLPEVASDDELAAANALMAISSFGSNSIGSAVAGLIAAKFSIDWAFYIDALSFAVSATCIVGIRVERRQIGSVTSIETVVHNLREGVRFLVDTPALRSLFLIFIPCFLLFGFNNAASLTFAMRALHASAFQFGLMESLRSVGFILASLLLASRLDRLREGQWIAISFLGMGLFLLVYSQSVTIPLATAMVMMAGFLNAPSMIARQLVIQRNTTREVRGRVNSAFFFIRSGAWLVGMASAGLADRIDIRLLFLISSLGLLTIGIIVTLLPGLGQPAAEWRRIMALLRAAGTGPSMQGSRPAAPADIDLLIGELPALWHASPADRAALLVDTSIVDVPSGATIIRQGEISNAAYVVLDGRVVVGREEQGRYRLLEVLNVGDVFGEIAALAGVPRTAQAIAERKTRLLCIPSATFRALMRYPEFRRLIHATMSERLVRLDMPDLPIDPTNLDQQSLLELRTSDPQPS